MPIVILEKGGAPADAEGHTASEDPSGAADGDFAPSGRQEGSVEPEQESLPREEATTCPPPDCKGALRALLIAPNPEAPGESSLTQDGATASDANPSTADPSGPLLPTPPSSEKEQPSGGVSALFQAVTQWAGRLHSLERLTGPKPSTAPIGEWISGLQGSIRQWSLGGGCGGVSRDRSQRSARFWYSHW